MPYQPFYELFPEIAKGETRSITVLEDSDLGLPPGDYAFYEMFCNETGCDCRRVFFYVVSSSRQDVEAVIAWGWETRDFYQRWLNYHDPKIIAELKGPALNIGSPQTALAPAILELCKNVLLVDQGYVDRVKRHYRMFRREIGGKPKVRSTPRRVRRNR